MKKIIILFALLFSSALSAQTYDAYDIEFNNLVDMMNRGGKAPKVRYLQNTLTAYNTHLSEKLEPFFRELMSQSIESGHRLSSVENIPTLKTIIAGCINSASEKLAKVQTRTLGADNLDAYATVVTCGGYIRSLLAELNFFFAGNQDYLIDNGYKEAVFNFVAKASDSERDILEQSNLYLRFLIQE